MTKAAADLGKQAKEPSLFDYQVYGPCWWRTTSTNLRAAAVILLSRESDVRGPGLLLYGFALENLLKGCLAAHLNEFGSCTDGHLPKKLNTHNLACLSRNCKFPASADDIRVFQTLTQWSEWRGRYHIPKAENPPPDTNGRECTLDVGVLDNLFDRVLRHFWQKMVGQADSRRADPGVPP